MGGGGSTITGSGGEGGEGMGEGVVFGGGEGGDGPPGVVGAVVNSVGGDGGDGPPGLVVAVVNSVGGAGGEGLPTTGDEVATVGTDVVSCSIGLNSKVPIYKRGYSFCSS